MNNLLWGLFFVYQNEQPLLLYKEVFATDIPGYDTFLISALIEQSGDNIINWLMILSLRGRPTETSAKKRPKVQEAAGVKKKTRTKRQPMKRLSQARPSSRKKPPSLRMLLE